jgi:SAM-dependent methyltransferase
VRCPGRAAPLWIREPRDQDQEFAEPVALSSTNPLTVRFRVEPSRLSLDLITLRARKPSQVQNRQMAFSDLRTFMRANLPEPPARVLEVGAGAGCLARALHAVGYDVLAIDPESESDDVRAVALADLDEPAGSFAAAVAVVSLHHIDPLEDSCRRLGELVEPAGTLLVDEFDVSAFDTAAASWWLEQRRALGEPQPETAEELVAEHREHLHPLERILAALEPHFELGPPLRGAWLHRWNLAESVRAIEEEAIARGHLRATGARLVGRRRG